MMQVCDIDCLSRARVANTFKFSESSDRAEEKAVPETEQDLALMKKLVDVGNKLRGYAELRLRVAQRQIMGNLTYSEQMHRRLLSPNRHRRNAQ